MSKFTILMVLELIKVLSSFVAKSLRVVLTIIDLVDDGCKNNSVPVPNWINVLSDIAESLQGVSCDIDRVPSVLEDYNVSDDEN